MKNTTTEKLRSFETELEIDASPDEVWRALTEAEQLMRWFPQRAEVTPGRGGSMKWSWGDGWDWETSIEAWEPGRLLRLVQDYAPSDGAERAVVAMEFTLESRAGKTRLRLVHSGFGHGAAWDNEIDSISEGWPSELRSLRFYLERHQGRDRHLARVSRSVSGSPLAVWQKLTGPGGFQLNPVEPVAGGRFEVTTPNGDRLHGTAVVVLPQRSLSGIVKEMGNALFRLSTWKDTQGRTQVWVWVASYGKSDAPLKAFTESTRRALEQLFPDGE